MKNTLKSTFGALAAGLVLTSTTGCHDPFKAERDANIKSVKAQFENDFKEEYAVTSTNGSARPYQAALGRVIADTKASYTVGSIFQVDKDKIYGERVLLDDKGLLLLEKANSLEYMRYSLQDTPNKDERNGPAFVFYLQEVKQ